MAKRGIAVTSDWHVNSTVGLWPPNFHREGGHIPQNKFQAWLWKNWLDFCKDARSQSRIAIINGDALQGIHPSRDVQTVVPSRTDMVRAAVQVAQPFIQGADRTYVLKGTDWHEGASGDDVEDFASQIGATVCEDTGQFSYWTLKLELDGKVFAFSHHTSVASVYFATPLQREWREFKERAADWGEELPDCIVHSHVHRWWPYIDKRGRLTFTTPGWQLANAYGYKFKPFYPPDIGGLLLWVEKGKIEWREKLYRIPQPQPISLSKNSYRNSASRRTTPDSRLRNSATYGTAATVG